MLVSPVTASPAMGSFDSPPGPVALVSSSSPRITQTQAVAGLSPETAPDASSSSPSPTFWNMDDSFIGDRFAEYLETVAGQKVLLQNIEDPSVLGVLFPRDHSRYFPGGRAKMRRRVRGRLAGFGIRRAVLLCLTYDPKKLSREQAWAGVGGHLNVFMTSLRQYLVRRKAARPVFFWVLEEQPGTGYPHLHFVMADRGWLAPWKVLAPMWGHGRIKVEKAKGESGGGAHTVSGVSYALKYLYKVGHWSARAVAYSWWFGRRWFGTCQFTPACPAREPQWTLFAVLSRGDFCLARGDGQFEHLGGAGWQFWRDWLREQGYELRDLAAPAG